jgi:hypothetical protein
MKKAIIALALACAAFTSTAHAGDTCDAFGQRIYPLFIDVAVDEIGVDRKAALKMWPRDKAIAEIIEGVKGSPDFVEGGTCEILIVLPDASLRNLLSAYMTKYFSDFSGAKL